MHVEFAGGPYEQLLTIARSKGNPVDVHGQDAGIEPFERWQAALFYRLDQPWPGSAQ